MPSLDDEEDLPIPETMDLVVRPSHVGEDGEAIGVFVEKNR